MAEVHAVERADRDRAAAARGRRDLGGIAPDDH